MTSDGLKNVVLTESEMSFLDGDKGELVYKGYDINELAYKVRFEEIFHLFWEDGFPTQKQFDETCGVLAKNRPVNDEVKEIAKKLADADMHPMAALRTLISSLAAYDPDSEVSPLDVEANYRKAERIAAKMVTLIAAFDRYRRGLDAVEPDPELSHAGNFLYMLNGERPSEEAEEIFDTCLVLHADHGFNASTFAARVTASTLSDVHSTITSAIGALKGLIHGGANSEVMKMLLEIDERGIDPVDYVKEKLAAGEVIMGFGHAVYNTIDPRSPYLREMCKKLGEEKDELKWYEYSTAIEDFMEEEKGIRCNVDFYSASVYYLLGIPIDLYTTIFAASRVVGWLGHVMEQYDENTLIRPRAKYVGPQNQKLVPMEERG